MKIAIDVGHADGTGAGAGGLEEHALSAAIAPILAARLREAGHVVRVIDFPELSNEADFVKAVQVANAWRADVFVSLQCDASSNAQARGAHVIYYSDAGRRLALAISQPLCKLMPGRAQQLREGSFYVLRRTAMPAVIVEQGFITHAQDRVALREGRRIALAIAEGLEHYASCL